MSAMLSQITSLTSIYSSAYSGAGQRKHQSSASLTFVRGIHPWPVNSPHKWPVTRKMFPFDDVIICLLSSFYWAWILCHKHYAQRAQCPLYIPLGFVISFRFAEQAPGHIMPWPATIEATLNKNGGGWFGGGCVCVCVCGGGGGGDLLNLRALKISIFYEKLIFQCVVKIYRAWNSTPNILPLYWKIIFTGENSRALRFKSSYVFLKRPPENSNHILRVHIMWNVAT